MTFEEILKEQGSLAYTNVGVSMLPLIKEGRDVVLIEKADEYKLYDVVLFKRDGVSGRGEYVLHRIMKIKGTQYYIVGDNVAKGEWVNGENILGKLTAIKTGDKTLKVTDKEYLDYTHKIVRYFPLRTLFLATRHFAGKTADGTFTEFIDDWKWIFSFSKRYKKIIVLYVILGVFSSTLTLGAAYISRIMINIITGKDVSKLWFLIIMYLSSTIFSLVFSSIMSRVNAKVNIYVNNDIQSEIFDKILDANWDELNNYENGDILNRFNRDTLTIAENSIVWIPNVIISIYTFVLTFIVICRMDYIMALIALMSAPVLFFMSHYVMSKLKEYKKKVLKMNSEMMSFEMETFYNFDSIKAFGINDFYSNELKGWQEKYKEYNLDYNKFEIKTHIEMTLLQTFVSMVAFGYCLYRLWTGQILYGDMTFFLTQRAGLSSKFASLIRTIPAMLTSSISAHRVRELVEIESEVHNAESYDKVSEVAKDGLTIELNDISYAYKDDRLVYKDTSFVAKPNEIVAIFAESGGGKTTLFRIMLALTKPKKGTVALKDKYGNAVDMNADLRKFVSYVPQGNSIVLGSVAKNMRMVKSDATDEEIIEALKIAHAWEFIEPLGLDYKLRERGKGLSEGQGQRIAIARAILRDAPILMLDEATSALDENTENEVLNSIKEHSDNKTIIISSHRQSVLRISNRVYKIKDKEICQ